MYEPILHRLLNNATQAGTRPAWLPGIQTHAACSAQSGQEERLHTMVCLPSPLQQHALAGAAQQRLSQRHGLEQSPKSASNRLPASCLPLLPLQRQQPQRSPQSQFQKEQQRPKSMLLSHPPLTEEELLHRQ